MVDVDYIDSSVGLAEVLKGTTHIVIMQYTGLKDKNGKEIYEGDIGIPAQKGLADFVYKIFSVVKMGAYDNGEEYEDRISGYGWYWDCKDKNNIYPLNEPLWEMEVIGNIYENPDLLKNNLSPT